MTSSARAGRGAAPRGRAHAPSRILIDSDRPISYTAAHRPLYAAFESQQSVLHTAERS